MAAGLGAHVDNSFKISHNNFVKTITEFLNKRTKQAANGCYLFSGHIHKTGYGQQSIKGKVYLAHRVAYALANNIPIALLPPTDFVLHSCDNPKCCNPAHLRTGTTQDNSADMVSRNRAAKPKGQLHPNHKLTDAEVRAIRSLYVTGLHTQKQIGSMFNIGHQLVSKVVNKVRWSHI